MFKGERGGGRGREDKKEIQNDGEWASAAVFLFKLRPTCVCGKSEKLHNRLHHFCSPQHPRDLCHCHLINCNLDLISSLESQKTTSDMVWTSCVGKALLTDTCRYLADVLSALISVMQQWLNSKSRPVQQIIGTIHLHFRLHICNLMIWARLFLRSQPRRPHFLCCRLHAEHLNTSQTLARCWRCVFPWRLSK